MTEDAENGDLVAGLSALAPKLPAGLIAYLGPDRGDDAFAEAMLYAWSNPEKFRSLENPLQFLFRVGRSRTRQRRQPVSLPPICPDTHEPIFEPQLHAALMTLTARQRTALVMVKAWGWSLKR